MRVCEEYAALLDMYVDGFCTAEEAEQVRKHLAVCESCRMYVTEILQMKEAFPDAEETEVPDGFAEGVMAAIRAEAAPQKKRMKPWQRTLLQMAACIAIVIALGPLSARLTGGMTKDAAMEMSMANNASKAQAPQAPAMMYDTADVWDAKVDVAEAPESSHDMASVPSAGETTEPYQGTKQTYARTAKVKLSRQQMESLLSGYEGTEKNGGVAYVLTDAEFDAVLAKLPAEARIPGEDLVYGNGESCLLMVYPTE